MATLSISVSGSALVNGAKSYTISDADLQRVLNWARAIYGGALPPSPTNVQILLAWVQAFVDGTTHQEQNFSTPAPVPPTPISIT